MASKVKTDGTRKRAGSTSFFKRHFRPVPFPGYSGEWDGVSIGEHDPELEDDSELIWEYDTPELKEAITKAAQENRAWTWVSEGEYDCVEAGIHWVNRMGYLITEVPFESSEDYYAW